VSTDGNDPYAGMSAEDADRARAFIQNQRAIQAKREAAARALLAPPGPAAEVKVAWRPIQDAIDAQKAGGGAT
jgi:hypothetical protein